MTQVQDVLTNLYASIVQGVTDWTPRVVLGLVLAIIAILLARIVTWMLRSFLRRIDIDGLLQKLGTKDTLGRLGVSQPLSVLLPKVVYYLLLLLFARTAAESMGLQPVSSAIGSFLAYLPSVFAALLIVLLGSSAAQLASRVVTEGARNSGIEFARPLGGIVGTVVMTIVGLTALAQLRVDTEIVHLVVSGILAGLVLALGLSFGLGSRDVTRNILAGFYARKTFASGDRVEIEGHRGTLLGITATQTLVESDGNTVAFANSIFLDSVTSRVGVGASPQNSVGDATE